MFTIYELRIQIGIREDEVHVHGGRHPRSRFTTTQHNAGCVHVCVSRGHSGSPVSSSPAWQQLATSTTPAVGPVLSTIKRRTDPSNDKQAHGIMDHLKRVRL